MDDLLIQRRLSIPVSTGSAGVLPSPAPAAAQQQEAAGGAMSFLQVFEQLQSQSEPLTFSKHAVQRLEQREIELSPSRLERLSEGVRIARQKGLNEPLIIVDDSAFVVNAGAGKVITGLQGLSGRVITNIDGTVIV